MADGGHPQVEVAVALVTNWNNQVLLVLNDRWNAFNIPMTRRRRSRDFNEPMPRAAIRAAAEAVGTPVRLVEKDHKRLPAARLPSGRQLATKDYVYDVYHVEPHPDFADRLQVRPPHLWLSPHQVLSGAYEPISESAQVILRAVIKDFEIRARVQHTSVLIIQRDDPERGKEFLVRKDPDWGYALPTKRWETEIGKDHAEQAMASAERVVREELGLEPGRDVTIAPARFPELTTHGVILTKEAPSFAAETDYIHSLFDAAIIQPEKIRSEAALAWVTADEVRYLRTAGSHGEPGAPSEQPDRISRTTYEILLHLGHAIEAVDREIAEEAKKEADKIRARLK